MKKITVLFALILGFGAVPKAQTCNFTYSQNPGSNTVTYQAPTNSFPGMLYFFSWQFSNSNSYSFGSTVTQTYNQSTTETVVLDIYGPDSTIICSSTQTIQISVTAPPCSFTYNQTAPSTFVFTSNQTGANLQVTWSFGDGSSGSGSIVEHNYLNNGTYMVTMSVIVNGDTCTSTMAVYVLNNNPNDSTLCNFYYQENTNAINSYTFYTTGGIPSASYSWNFGDGTTGAGSQLVHQFPGAGTYTVCLTAGANGAVVCENCFNVVVGNTNPAPSNCNANFTYSTSDLTAFFINQSANSYINTNTSYSWSFGDGQYSSSPFPYHTYNQAGDYNVCLTVVDANCADTICTMVSVPTTPVNPPDSCSAYFVISQQSPFSVDVVNMSNGSSYVWTIAGISNTSAFPVITVPFIGSYLLCLTVTNPNGCVATYCDSLTIDSTGIVQRNAQSEFTINVVSPAQITGFSATSINTVSTINNEIFPNPFSNSFTVNNANSDKINYEVYSIDGKMVQQGIITNKVETINAESLTNGLYMLSLINSKGERSVTKINKN
jgi:PKD repeat protein